MTLFRDVFQRHLAQRENEPAPAATLDELAPHTASLEAVPAPMPVPTLDLPTAESHGMLPSERHGEDAATQPSSLSSGPKLDATDPDIAARAAEAHRLIAETQVLRQPAAPSAVTSAGPSIEANIGDPTPVRPNRARTRLLGFGDAGSGYVDPMSDLGESAAQPQFPCGWLVVIKGPGRGASFALHAGISQIGRGDDQAISLDFGDRAISREQHAVVAYDPELGKFFLGHGGKSNIIRLNERPVLSTEDMAHGDTISIGETVLRFAAFCDQSFGWGEEGS